MSRTTTDDGKFASAITRTLVVFLVTSFCLFAIATLGALLFVATWKVDLGRYAGSSWDFTYYGHYHRVRKAIESKPGWIITNTWTREGPTLEDFGFRVIDTNTVKAADVDFYEFSPQMNLSSKEEIQEFVQGELNRGARRE